MNTFEGSQGRRLGRPVGVSRTGAEQKSGGGLGRWEAVIPNPKLKLMHQVKEVLRVKHYAKAERSIREFRE
jgi:hypothetical protein